MSFRRAFAREKRFSNLPRVQKNNVSAYYRARILFSQMCYRALRVQESARNHHLRHGRSTIYIANTCRLHCANIISYCAYRINYENRGYTATHLCSSRKDDGLRGQINHTFGKIIFRVSTDARDNAALHIFNCKSVLVRVTNTLLSHLLSRKIEV